ncbi:UNVERIFIED_CONTAM: putative RNA-binding protein 19 [Siphonaria sp. JEL0065]|nr:putative RNA-binding protein 19 [Siphonaria sp. JEL0065]
MDTYNQTTPTSRLMVRNLPKHLTLERLRDHFAQRSPVTDVKLAKDKDGNSRRFGFIGFRNEKDAKEALSYFNRTFIDTSKIEVMYAKPVGDAAIPRPWSKHTEGSSANSRILKKQEDAKKAEEAAVEENLWRKEKASATASKKKKDADNAAAGALADVHNAVKSDPKFQEFLDVMRPRGAAKGRTWANDDLGKEFVWDPKAAGVSTEGEEDDELYQDLKLKEGTDGEEVDELLEEEQDPQPDAIAHDSGLSDMEYLRSRMRSKLADEEDPFGGERLDDDDQQAEVEEEVEDEDDIMKENDANDDDDEPSSDTEQPPISPGKAKVAQQIKDMFTEPEPSTTKSNDDHNDDLPELVKLKEAEQVELPAEIIADTGRLFVKNLAFTCTTDNLKELFGTYGPLSEIHMSIDRETKKPRGYAFIMYLLPEHAVKAYTTLNGQIFQGRILDILPGQEKKKTIEEDENLLGADASYKKKLELKKKKTANNEYSWNSLFINSDAVAEAMARKLNVKKSDILDPSSENMAVRLALAETDIINETKTYLEEEGIDLNAFSRHKTRSTTILLAKNIPAHTTTEEIEVLFSKFGSLGRIVVPPSGTIAMVEFLEPNECKGAFRRLAYTKFKTLPLFLEFAPVGAFKNAFDAEDEAKRKAEKAAKAGDALEDEQMEDVKKGGDEETDGQQSIDVRVAKAVAKTSTKKLSNKEVLEKSMAASSSSTTGASTSAMDDPDAMPVATLFVKNLSFATTEDNLRKKFTPVGGLRSVRIATKPDTKKGGGAVLSMGFGFLEFERKEDAIKAVKALQNVELDGHKLQLKFSNATGKGNTAAAASAAKRNMNDEDEVRVTGTKLIVRNIPFQATKKDIKQLFSTFGQVKTVRLPTKFDGTHRGFGFVDFLTKQEAKAAFSTLGSTHLYGRHLVMEWAEDESSVEAMRNKTAKNFVKDGEGGGGKRRRVILGDDEEEANAMSD